MLAANPQGHAVAVTGLSPVAMACSPIDSTLDYIDAEDHKLYSVNLVWTADTLYLGGTGTPSTGRTFGNYVDWAEYSGQ